MAGALLQRYERSPDVLSQNIGEETILLDLRGDRYYALDEVGSRIWRLLGDGHTGREVVGFLLRDYEVGRGQAERDVAECIAELLERGLLLDIPTRDEAPGAPCE